LGFLVVLAGSVAGTSRRLFLKKPFVGGRLATFQLKGIVGQFRWSKEAVA
jgi:hypothetical protein